MQSRLSPVSSILQCALEKVQNKYKKKTELQSLARRASTRECMFFFIRTGTDLNLKWSISFSSTIPSPFVN